MRFVAHQIRASNVNLIMNDYTAGLPSPLSFLGLGDLLMRRLGGDPWAARVIPILHQVVPSKGRTKPEMEPKGSIFSPVEMIENQLGYVVLSLVLDLPGVESEASVAEVLSAARIAGGSVQNRFIRVSAISPDGPGLQSVRRGVAMIPPVERPDWCEISCGSTESLGRVAQIVFPAAREPGSGWPIPVAAGYRLLEDPENVPSRIGVRSRDVPHVFAEPVLGVAELLSIRNPRLRQAAKDDLDRLFWRWFAKDDFVVGHSVFHPVNH